MTPQAGWKKIQLCCSVSQQTYQHAIHILANGAETKKLSFRFEGLFTSQVVTCHFQLFQREKHRGSKRVLAMATGPGNISKMISYQVNYIKKTAWEGRAELKSRNREGKQAELPLIWVSVLAGFSEVTYSRLKDRACFYLQRKGNVHCSAVYSL